MQNGRSGNRYADHRSSEPTKAAFVDIDKYLSKPGVPQSWTSATLTAYCNEQVKHFGAIINRRGPIAVPVVDRHVQPGGRRLAALDVMRSKVAVTVESTPHSGRASECWDVVNTVFPQGRLHSTRHMNDTQGMRFIVAETIKQRSLSDVVYPRALQVPCGRDGQWHRSDYD